MGIQKNNISIRDLSHSELRPLLVDLSSQNQLDLTKTDVLKGLAKGKLQRKGIGVYVGRNAYSVLNFKRANWTVRAYP